MTDEQICSLWRAAGGRIHGPIVETATIPVSRLLPLMHSIIDERDALRAERQARASVIDDVLDQLAKHEDDNNMEY